MRDEGRAGAIQQQHAAEGDPAPAGGGDKSSQSADIAKAVKLAATIEE